MTFQPKIRKVTFQSVGVLNQSCVLSQALDVHGTGKWLSFKLEVMDDEGIVTAAASGSGSAKNISRITRT